MANKHAKDERNQNAALEHKEDELRDRSRRPPHHEKTTPSPSRRGSEPATDSPAREENPPQTIGPRERNNDAV